MSNILNRVLLPCRTPLTQFQRFRGRVNIQRPRQPHYERAKVLAVTQPRYPEPPKTLTCFQPAPERLQATIENPYNDIIAREVHNWLQQSRMVAVFHMNSISADELFRVRVLLHKQNMHLKSYGRKIIAKAVAGTRFEAIVPLFESNHCIVFSSEERVAQLLRSTRKVPQLLLLAGIVDERLLSRNEFVAYAQLPGLQAAQAELVQTLSMCAGGGLVQSLEAHQLNLVSALDVYAKGTTATAEEEVAKKAAEPASETQS